jgi:uncharacterized protein YajQ (UPF0234 family)
MPKDSSFDVVSKVDRQEVDNALNQAAREIGQRFDFRNTGTSVAWSSQTTILVEANAEDRALAALDVLQEKLIKRGVSLKALETGDPRTSGQKVQITSSVKEGISAATAKTLSKLIRDEGPKGVKVQTVGDELRVSGKKRDDLQAVIALLKGADVDEALQFVNYR